MEIQIDRLLKHVIPLFLYASAVAWYLYGMGVELRTRLLIPPWKVHKHFADWRNDPRIIATTPAFWTTAMKWTIAVAPWIWWACRVDAADSVYWKLLAGLALAVLAPPVLFPYVDVTYVDEAMMSKIFRWFRKIIDVAAKKWSLALIAGGLCSWLNWNPAKLFMPFYADEETVPTAANAVAVIAIISIYVRSLYLAGAIKYTPWQAILFSLACCFVVGSVFVLAVTLSPPHYFFASVVALGVSGGFVGVLADGIGDHFRSK